MNFILQQGKEIVFKVSHLFINRSFMILIETFINIFEFFLSSIDYQNLEDLHYTL